jgi:hypothetical protein
MSVTPIGNSGRVGSPRPHLSPAISATPIGGSRRPDELFFAAAVLLAGGLAPSALAQCNLGNGIKHVVYIQFDNVHFRRDNPNVPSDLEQMPNLLNFLTDNGTFQTNHWTPLIPEVVSGRLAPTLPVRRAKSTPI